MTRRMWLPGAIVLALQTILLSYVIAGTPAGAGALPAGFGTPVGATPGRAGATPAPAGAGDPFSPGEVVVKLDPAAIMADVALQYGLDPVPIDQFGARPIYRLRIADGAAPPDKAAALAADAGGRVVYAEPNYIGQTPEGRQQSSWESGGDAGVYAEQWAPERIRLPAAHTVTRGGGVTVAVLDTGVDAAHPALAGRVAGGFDFVDSDADPREVGTRERHKSYGHGTHVAGLVALAAPDARIMPLRVLDEDGAGNIWVLAEALAYAADPDGDPATDDGADVINLSLGTLRPTSLLRDVIALVTCADGNDDGACLAAAQRGAVVVLAAGNGGGGAPEFPAAEAVAGSLAVGASTEADTLAPFSTRGPWVRVAAPGVRVISSVPGGGYGAWSGTSMAAPLTAGQAALLRAADADLWSVDVVERIVATAAPLDGPVPPRIDAAAGLGLAANP